jgi:hypothetical protein
MDFLTDPYLPRIDISSYIQVLGDFFSLNSSDPRSITSVKLFFDYDTMQINALEETLSYFNNYFNNSLYSAKRYVCSSF